MTRCHRALMGILAAGLLSLPLLAGTAAAEKAAKPAAKPAKKPAKPAASKADPKAGRLAFKNEGCVGCHKTKEEAGGEQGPDLSTLAKDHKADQIAKYITNPKAGSIMPAFKAKDAKAKAILDNMVAYLMTQK